MKSTIDLFPEEYYSAIAVRRRISIWSGLLAAVAGAILLGAFVLWNQVARAERHVSEMKARVQEMEQWGTQLTPLISELETARDKQRVLAQLIREPQWSNILNTLAHASVDDVWLQDFVVQHEIGGTPESAQSQHMFRIGGVARSHSELIGFMARMAESPHVVRMKPTNTRKAGEFEQPDILTFELEGEVL